MRLYVGVHSSPAGLFGAGIQLATEAYCRPPWLLGAAHPATHAFVAWSHDDGTWYRVDGRMPHAGTSVRLAGGLPFPVEHEALWELTGVNVGAAVAHAIDLCSTPYDLAQIVAQALPDPLHLFHGDDALTHAHICTELAREVMRAAGGEAAKVAAALHDLYPETMGQLLQRATLDGWCVRVK